MASQSPTPSSSPSTPSLSPPKHSTDKTKARINALRSRQASLQATLATLTIERDTLVEKTLHSASQTLTPSTTDQALCPGQEEIDVNSVVAIRTEQALAISTAKMKLHVKQLQQYNDLKDIGQQLIGLIAEKKGVRIVEVQREFGVDGND